jgi:hypothetical protein
VRKFYLSKIEVVEDPMMGTTVRHRLQIAYPGVEWLGGDIEGEIGSLPPALLVMIADVNHKQFQDDPKLIPIPHVVGGDQGVAAIAVPAKLKAKADIIALGYDEAETDAVWQNTAGMRDVLNHYGRKNNPAFDVDKFDLYAT